MSSSGNAAAGLMIEVKGLTKVYKSGEVAVQALRGITLQIGRGEFVAVVGPSGSGKSTLFHILGGLAPPTAGDVWVDGQDLRKLTDLERTKLRQKKIGFVFQKYNLLPTLSAQDNIEMARYLSGNTKRSTDFNKVLDLLGVRNRLQHKPRAMSGGEQQRVAIARALVNEPAMLLADEPTGNLDTENSSAVLRLLQHLNHNLGQTILMITHNPEAAAYADRILTMRDGRIVS